MATPRTLRITGKTLCHICAASKVHGIRNHRNTFKETKIALSEFERLLGIQIGSKTDIGQIISRTDGKRIAQIKIGGKTLTGKEVREKLNLKSSDFTWYRTGNQIVVTTKGYGHGVGMSQYGANGMAQEGKHIRKSSLTTIRMSQSMRQPHSFQPLRRRNK